MSPSFLTRKRHQTRDGSAEAEPAAVQLLSEPPAAAADVVGDVALVVSEVLDGPAPTPAVTSSDGAETLSLQGGGGVGVSGTPSCPPPHPGGHVARTGGTRHAPRPTRPARVPEPVARVIAALPLTEQQRLWARTHSPKEADGGPRGGGTQVGGDLDSCMAGPRGRAGGRPVRR